jgi:tetratricopeptide (TPR) repeat protein
VEEKHFTYKLRWYTIEFKEINMNKKDIFNQGLFFIYKQKNPDKAIDAFTDVIKMDPELSSAFLNRGNCYFKKSLYEEAIQDYDSTLLLRPQNIGAYKIREWAIYFKIWSKNHENHMEVNTLVNHAMESAWNDDHETALNYFLQIFQICSDNSFIFYQRGLLYAEIGESMKAIDNLSESIKLAPNIAAGYYDRGNLYREQKIYDKSLCDYNKAIELYPKFCDAICNRGIIHFLQKEYELAFEDFKTTLEINPDDEDARINLIRTVKYLN